MINLLQCLINIENNIEIDSSKKQVAFYFKNNSFEISENNAHNQILEICFNDLSISTLCYLSDSIYTSKTNKYRYYKFLLYRLTFSQMINTMYKTACILDYCLEHNYFEYKIIHKNIYFYSIDSVWNIVKNYLSNIHYIYKGTTILNISFNNIPLFDYLLTDAIKNRLYDPEYNIYKYYTNNYLLTCNIDYDISEFMNKCNDFRLYILSKLPTKYKYLKNLRRVKTIIVKNNIQALDYYLNKYSRWLDANTRLNNNWPLLDYVESVEMFYYLIKKGANINNLTIEPSYPYERYKEYYLTNTIYNNIYFALENMDIYYKQGCDIGVSKNAIKKYIKLNSRVLYGVSFYSYIRLLSSINKYKRKTYRNIRLKLKSILYEDLISKVLTYI
jgi:hypothetical protein